MAGTPNKGGEQLLDATAIVAAEALKPDQHGTIVIEAPVKNGKIQWIEANFRRRLHVDGQRAAG